MIQSKNLRNKQKAIFLDRDGTMNKYVGFLRDIEQFELLPGVVEAIRLINASGYLAIVCTNQPVIARRSDSFSVGEDTSKNGDTSWTRGSLSRRDLLLSTPSP